MSLDEITDEILSVHYSFEQAAPLAPPTSYLTYFQHTQYTAFHTPSEVKEYMYDCGLATFEKFNGYIYLTDLGKAIAASGGWLAHLNEIKIQNIRRENEDRALNRKSAIGSHRSGLYATWAFWLSIASLVATIANSIWPGLLSKLLGK